MTIFRRFLNWLANISQAFAAWLNEKPGDDSPVAAGELGTPPTLLPDNQHDPVQVKVIATPEFPLETTEARRYVKKRALLSPAESELFDKLLRAIGHDYQIFACIRLSDVMFLQNQPEDRKYHVNQIICKHFDFVLCHFKSTEPLLAIELNDDSHKLFNRRKSDEFKESVCREIGLPLLWLYNGDRISVAQLARDIHAKIDPTGASTQPS